MVSVRPATVHDLIGMQSCNLFCLPENYAHKYYFLHLLSWSSLLYVAEEPYSKKIVGYVLAKIDEDQDGIHGHITSLSVLRSYRKLGLATKLMRCTLDAMKESYDADFVSLHVRVSNRAAFTLYRTVLGFEIHDVEKGYYADKEDAYDMRLRFKESNIKSQIGGRKKQIKKHSDGMGELDNVGDNAFSEGPKKIAEDDDEGITDKTITDKTIDKTTGVVEKIAEKTTEVADKATGVEKYAETNTEIIDDNAAGKNKKKKKR